MVEAEASQGCLTHQKGWSQHSVDTGSVEDLYVVSVSTAGWSIGAPLFALWRSPAIEWHDL